MDCNRLGGLINWIDDFRARESKNNVTSETERRKERRGKHSISPSRGEEKRRTGFDISIQTIRHSTTTAFNIDDFEHWHT